MPVFDQDKEMFLVSLENGQATDIMTYGVIVKGIDNKFKRESELRDKGE